MAAAAAVVWENKGMTPEAERAKASLEACRFWTEQSRALRQLEQQAKGGGVDLRERRQLADKSMKQARKRAETVRGGAVLSIRQMEVLEWRYFSALPWHEVITRMELSKSRVMELHAQALEACGAWFRQTKK